jgi:uncharacterized protein DUF5752
MTKNNEPVPFALMDCALLTLATGKKALGLRELRDRITEVDESSLYYHFFENLLRPSFDDPEYRNDFALWARRSLHDAQLAEKLGMIDPLACCDLEDLRQTLLDVIEDHLAENEYPAWAIPSQGFHFLTSRVVVFDTGRSLETIEELGKCIPEMTTGSIYYHYIEARRRQPNNEDDFSMWMMQWGDDTKSLRDDLDKVDYYFWTLQEIRKRLAGTFSRNGEARK